VVSEVERTAYAAAKAFGAAVIRAIGCDPEHPTVEQAQIAARLILILMRHACADMDDNEIAAFVESAMELRDEIERETH
jgi:hypothetical protein